MTSEEMKAKLIQNDATLRQYRSELADAVNELCLHCGQYKEQHKGACDGCRWKERRSGDLG